MGVRDRLSYIMNMSVRVREKLSISWTSLWGLEIDCLYHELLCEG